MNAYSFQPIGFVSSCFKEKFGIPRQAGLVPEARGILEVIPPYNRPEAFRELADYSHIWLTFVFHGNPQGEWSPTVRPPRLGGNKRVGVFASRSPFRPNPIGLSVVRLERLELRPAGVRLHLGGIDLLDGTPVLDIKPYLPYSDAIAEARAGYAPQAPQARHEIGFSAAAENALAGLPSAQAEHLRLLIRRILALDPRPGYRRGAAEQRRYGMRLYDYDLRWEIDGERIRVVSLETAPTGDEP